MKAGCARAPSTCPGIVGLGAAAEICRSEMPSEAPRLRGLRDRLLESLRRELTNVRVNGPLGEWRLPHNLHVTFDGVEGERLLMAIGDLAVSTGSACSSGSQSASHVLEAIGAADRPGRVHPLRPRPVDDRGGDRRRCRAGRESRSESRRRNWHDYRPRITVAHSPDSDDAFMFYGLASNNVDTGGIIVDQVLSDIETLNRAAFDGKYEVTAVSFHAFAHLADRYALLPHGASMGDNYGPIVVAAGSGSAPSLEGVAGVKGKRSRSRER